MFIESVRNRNSPLCILLRETYRLDGKVRHRTIANLSKWPANLVQGLRRLLQSERHLRTNPNALPTECPCTASRPYSKISPPITRTSIVPKLPGAPAWQQET